MDDFDDIKKAVSSKQFYEPIGADPLPHQVVDLGKMIEETPNMAPIFVRVDKYKEILTQIKDLKSTITDLEKTLVVRKYIHKFNAQSDEILERALKRFSESTDTFGREFITPRGAEQFSGNKPEDAVDGTISQLSEEILKLKQELEKIKL